MKRNTARALPTTSPGTKEKRSAKALEKTAELLHLRETIANNVQWLLANSEARGSLRRFEAISGVGKTSIRRVLRASSGTTLDTLFLLADACGLPVEALFTHLSERDMRMVGMLAELRGDIETLKARSVPARN